MCYGMNLLYCGSHDVPPVVTSFRPCIVTICAIASGIRRCSRRDCATATPIRPGTPLPRSCWNNTKTRRGWHGCWATQAYGCSMNGTASLSGIGPDTMASDLAGRSVKRQNDQREEKMMTILKPSLRNFQDPSPQHNPLFFLNGECGIRTRDLRLARAALSHLS